VQKLGGRFCGKSCAALARGAEFDRVRRRAGRACWLKHGQVQYAARLAVLDQRPEVVTAPTKSAAFARGITYGLALATGAVTKYYDRQGWSVPPGLADTMRRFSRRHAQLLAMHKGATV